MTSNRYYSINEHYSSNGGYCNKLQIDSGLCGSSGHSLSSTSFITTSFKHGQSRDSYIGYGGAQCTVSDIQKATSVVNALNDTQGWGNQIFAALSVLFGDIKFECSSDNISGQRAEIRNKMFQLSCESLENKTKLQKLAGILQLKENKGELKSQGEKIFLEYFKEHSLAHSYFEYALSGYNAFSYSHSDATGAYYNQYEKIPLGFPDPLTFGYIKYNETQLKLDWSSELKKIDIFLKPETQSIYKVNGLTFNSQSAAENYIRSEVANRVMPYEILSKTGFNL